MGAVAVAPAAMLAVGDVFLVSGARDVVQPLADVGSHSEPPRLGLNDDTADSTTINAITFNQKTVSKLCRQLMLSV